MADERDITGHPHRDQFPVRNVDDRRWFEGYAVVAMNADQITATHRRIVHDINTEYQAKWFGKRWAQAAIVGGILGNVGLFIIEAVRISLGH